MGIKEGEMLKWAFSMGNDRFLMQIFGMEVVEQEVVVEKKNFKIIGFLGTGRPNLENVNLWLFGGRKRSFGATSTSQKRYF